VETILVWTCALFEAVLFVGLVVRRRVTGCYALLPLVVAWLAADVAVAVRPDVNTWDFWITKELTHALLAFAVGIELSCRVLVASTRGHYAAMGLLGANLFFAVALAATAPPGPMSVTVVPRLHAALAILYLGLLWVLVHHWLPADRLHRVVLVGLAVHAFLYWMTWSRTGSETAVAGFVNAVIFAGVLASLAWAAWAPDETLPAQPEIIKLVHPWTH
jgi:hypothetical protein